MLFGKKQTELYFKDLETPIGRWVNSLIVGLVLISSGIFVAETYNIPDSVRHTLNLIDNTILIVFVVEYLLRLWSTENRIQYVLSFYSIIDLIAIVPFFIGTFDTRFIRLLRWFRILRLIRFIDRRFLFANISTEDGVIFARIVFTLFAIVFVYSGLIYQVEHPVNSKVFRTFLDAFYFSIVTMTTVGFGDVTPISELGRLLTVSMILTGIALIPWQIGDLIKRLVNTINLVETVCSGCGWSFHDTDAHFCKICGTKLKKN
jgi:voltage-gated potassium channel